MLNSKQVEEIKAIAFGIYSEKVANYFEKYGFHCPEDIEFSFYYDVSSILRIEIECKLVSIDDLFTVLGYEVQYRIECLHLSEFQPFLVLYGNWDEIPEAKPTPQDPDCKNCYHCQYC
jgi:hypothetical protein